MVVWWWSMAQYTGFCCGFPFSPNVVCWVKTIICFKESEPLRHLPEALCKIWQNFSGKTAGFFTVTMLTHTRHSLSRSALQKQNSSRFSATLQPWSLPADLFLFPKFKVSLKGCQFEPVEEVQEKLELSTLCITRSAQYIYFSCGEEIIYVF